MSGRLFRGVSERRGGARLHARALLLLAGAIGLGAVFAVVAEGATPPAFAAKASLTPGLYYINDATGSAYTFTVTNTGTSYGIGAVEVRRPSTVWTVSGCTAPAGWTAQLSADKCRFRSTASRYGIAPRGGTKAFKVVAKTAPGNIDRVGTWGVTASRTTHFDNPSLLTPAGPNGGGLTTTLHTFQLTSAVVSNAPRVPGTPCPALVQEAVVGTQKTIVVCGRNRANLALAPTSQYSLLSGTFIKTKGTFSSGVIQPNSGNVVLAQWNNTTISDVFGSGKKVVTQVGSASNRKSPLRSFPGYSATSTPPVAAGDSHSTDEDAPLDVTAADGVLKNDSDPDGDPLAAVDATQPSHGTVVLNADGSFRYTPHANYHGPDSFTYKAFDTYTKSGSVTVAITVNPVNDVPEGTDDTATIGEDAGATAIPVLANDTDADGDTLTVSAVDTTGTLGTVASTGTGVTYSPNGKFEHLGTGDTATDTFSYTVRDPGTAEDTFVTVTVTITGVNDAPELGADTPSTDEATAIPSIAVLTNDTDDEGALTLTSIDTTGVEGTVVADTANGTVSYDPNRKFESLGTGQSDTETFGYTVTDTDGTTATSTVTVTVNGINDAPDGVADAATVSEDSEGDTLPILGNDTDAESQTLTVHSVDTTGTKGTVTNNGTDVTYDPNGQFETLGADDTATDTFTYTVRDSQTGEEAGVVVTVTIDGQNDSPDAMGDAVATDEATGVGPLAVLANDTDVEGPLTVTGFGTTGTKGKVTDNGDGTFSYDPDGKFENLANGATATDTFTYTVKDSDDATDTATVTVTVNGINDAPIGVNDAQTIGENADDTTVPVLSNDTDAESQTLTVHAIDTTATTGTVTNHGTHVSYDPNGRFEGLGSGQNATDTFTYTVRDSQSGEDTGVVVTVTISGDNDAPVATDDANATDEATQVGPINLLVNDSDAEGGVTLSSLNTTGTKGAVTNNNDGTVTYNPNGKFEGLANGASEQDTFTYTVTDLQGRTDTATVTITVNGINDAPVGGDDSPTVDEDSAGATVSVLGNDTDAESQTLTVTAINTTATTGTVTNNGTDVTYDPNGKFESLGETQTATDTFTYTVSDPQGGTDVVTVTVTIDGDNDDPVATGDASSTDEATQTGPINLLVNDSDAEGGLTVTAVGATTNGGTVTNNNDGTVTYAPNGAFEALAAGGTASDTFTYTVTDLDGATDTATVTITVNGINDAPVGVNDTLTVGENAAATAVTVLANDTDAESQALSVHAVDTTGTAGMVTTNGTTVSYAPNGMFDYLDDTETATDTFTYTVADAQGAQDSLVTVTVTVTGANDAPVANADGPFQTYTDSELTLTTPGVLSNDTDADGETLTAGNASDPAHGDVTLLPDGSFSYMPDSGYTGSDSFTYDVTDGTVTVTGTVTISVVSPNATPTAAATSASGNEDGGPITVNLTGTDADGDALTFTPLTATNGLVTVPAGVSCDANTPSTCTATVTYTPNANYFGTDTFTYTVNDGTVDSAPATATVTVNPLNDAPSFTKGANQTVLEDAGAQTVNGWATAISTGPANESGQAVTFTVSNNANGLFSAQPDVSDAGVLTYTPAADANGVATVTVYATDNGGVANAGDDNDSPSQTFTITVGAVNDAPSFTKGLDQTVNEDAPAQSISNWATAISKGPSDESTQTVSFTTSNDNNALFSVHPGVTPTGTLTYTLTPNAVGSATVTISLSDTGGTANNGDDTSDAQTFTITVNPVNDAPSFTTAGNQTVLEDAGAQTVNGFVTSASAGPADEGAQDVTVSVVSNDNTGLFSAQPTITNGVLTYTPAADKNGSATVTVKATDDGGTANGGNDTSLNQQFVINVTAVNDVPSFTAGANQTVNEDAGARSVSNWATALSKGPADEATQTLSFTVTNDRNSLFATQPEVSPSGTLTYTSAANQYGTATVSVAIKDNGGTANNGDDTSDVQTFTITVNPVNDAPVAAAKSYTVQANMKLSLGGLLTGATDPNDVAGDAAWSPTFTVGSITPGAGCLGCTITNVNNAAGTFDFDPPAGGTGTYTVDYTVVDNGHPMPAATSAAQTITFTVNGPVIWFVDTTASGAETGRLSQPFNTLAEATAAMGTDVNERIFVRGGNVSGNVTLPTDGWLISEAVTGASFDAVMGITPPATTIARPAVNGTQRTLTGTVTLGTNSVVRGFDISSGAGNGLVASGKTGLVVNQASVTSTTGRAVDLASSSGVINLTRVSSNGASRGISLVNTNVSTGSFTVTGTGSAGSGGTIQYSTATGSAGVGNNDGGIYLNNTKNVTLDRMNVTNGQGSGIYGLNVANFSLANSTVSANGTDVGKDHDGVRFDSLTGNASITGSTITGSKENNVRFRQESGTSTITVSGSTMSNNDPTIGANGMIVDSYGSAVTTVTVRNNQFTNNNTDGLAIYSNSSGAMTATVDAVGGANVFNGNHIGVDVAGNGTGPSTFVIDGVNVTGCATCGFPINAYKGTDATGSPMVVTIKNSTVNNMGSEAASGIYVHGEGAGALRGSIVNNTVRGVEQIGIWGSIGNRNGGPAATLDLNVTGNDVDLSAAGPNSSYAIFVESGTVPGDNNATCANIKSNRAITVAPLEGIAVSNYLSGTFRLPGFPGGNDGAVETFIVNGNTAPVTADAQSASGAGFTGGAACNTP